MRYFWDLMKDTMPTRSGLVPSQSRTPRWSIGANQPGCLDVAQLLMTPQAAELGIPERRAAPPLFDIRTKNIYQVASPGELPTVLRSRGPFDLPRSGQMAC
jgi:hypothetical protein